MRAACAILTLAQAAGGLPAVAADDPRVFYERNVVRLNVTYQGWDEDRPWAKRKPENRRASAVMVQGGALLTTAEMLDDATFIEVEIHGRTRRGQPTIERIDRTVNLALLRLGDSTGLEVAKVAARSPSSGTLRTVRWRGQQLEAAASRVIRVEVERTATGSTHHAFLRMRTDMAGGGWAEPVYDGTDLVGITVSQAEDESRAIPAEILNAFLKTGTSPGEPGGFTTLGVHWQFNRESAISRFLEQEGEPRGILIRQIPWGSSGCGVLKPRDILLELAGETIDAEGYYPHPWLGRIGFNQILAERFRPGDQVPARVHRAGREQEITLTARSYPSGLSLIPVHSQGAPPYLIAGGMVLREMDLPYLRTWGKDWIKDAPDRLLSRYLYQGDGQTPGMRRTVLIASVLPSSYNIGYHDLRDVVLERVNRQPIGKIEDVAVALQKPVDGYHVFDLAAESAMGRIVLDAATYADATTEILQEYGVPAGGRAREQPLPDGSGDCPGEY